MKRHLSDSETENCDDYEDCSSPEVRVQMSRKKRRGLIEKRRRDRINSCLVQLRKLVPAAFEKQGSAKLEKAEILQMTVEHLRYLQSRDPRGFGDPYMAYGGNPKAYLDHGIQGFKECAAEIARFMATNDSVDPTDVSKTRLLSHLENVISQKELAVAAMGVSPQIKLGPQPVSIMSVPNPPQAISIPYAAPLTPPRASPDNLSPPAVFPSANLGTSDSLPHFSVTFPIPTTPILSLASSANRTVPATAAVLQSSGFKPVIPVAQATPVSVVKPAPLLNGLPRPTAQPLTVITAPSTNVASSPLTPTSPPDLTVQADTNLFTLTAPRSPKMTNSLTKAPFRPWADSTKTATALTTNA